MNGSHPVQIRSRQTGGTSCPVVAGDDHEGSAQAGDCSITRKLLRKGDSRGCKTMPNTDKARRARGEYPPLSCG